MNKKLASNQMKTWSARNTLQLSNIVNTLIQKNTYRYCQLFVQVVVGMLIEQFAYLMYSHCWGNLDCSQQFWTIWWFDKICTVYILKIQRNFDRFVNCLYLSRFSSVSRIVSCSKCPIKLFIQFLVSTDP